MHEWALAEAILKTAEKIAMKEKLVKVSEIKIGFSELQRPDFEILQFALDNYKSGILEGCKFNISKFDTMLKCRVCENVWQFDLNDTEENTAEAIHFIPEVAHAYKTCPRCGSPDFIIESNRGVWIENITGFENDD